MKIVIHILIFITIPIACLLLVQCSSAPILPESSVSLQGSEWIVDLPNLKKEAMPLVLIRIPAGTFQMGSPDTEEGHEKNESPMHSVTISRDYYLGKHEVTQAQWEAVIGSNPSTEINPDFPVNKVSWHDCHVFLHRIGKIAQKSGFRLPTEAEWEYACRAGTSTATYFGDNPSEEEKEKYAWFRNNSNGELHIVGQFPPNPWGLFDMLGNVWEWCYDWYGPYTSGMQVDPTGPKTGSERVYRGASWMARPEWIRCADRGKFTPNNQRNTGGFRVAFSEK